MVYRNRAYRGRVCRADRGSDNTDERGKAGCRAEVHVLEREGIVLLVIGEACAADGLPACLIRAHARVRLCACIIGCNRVDLVGAVEDIEHGRSGIRTVAADCCLGESKRILGSTFGRVVVDANRETFREGTAEERTLENRQLGAAQGEVAAHRIGGLGGGCGQRCAAGQADSCGFVVPGGDVVNQREARHAAVVACAAVGVAVAARHRSVICEGSNTVVGAFHGHVLVAQCVSVAARKCVDKHELCALGLHRAECIRRDSDGRGCAVRARSDREPSGGVRRQAVPCRVTFAALE